MNSLEWASNIQLNLSVIYDDLLLLYERKHKFIHIWIGNCFKMVNNISTNSLSHMFVYLYFCFNLSCWNSASKIKQFCFLQIWRNFWNFLKAMFYIYKPKYEKNQKPTFSRRWVALGNEMALWLWFMFYDYKHIRNEYIIQNNPEEKG